MQTLTDSVLDVICDRMFLVVDSESAEDLEEAGDELESETRPDPYEQQ